MCPESLSSLAHVHCHSEIKRCSLVLKHILCHRVLCWTLWDFQLRQLSCEIQRSYCSQTSLCDPASLKDCSMGSSPSLGTKVIWLGQLHDGVWVSGRGWQDHSDCFLPQSSLLPALQLGGMHIYGSRFTTVSFPFSSAWLDSPHSPEHSVTASSCQVSFPNLVQCFLTVDSSARSASWKKRHSFQKPQLRCTMAPIRKSF